MNRWVVVTAIVTDDGITKRARASHLRCRVAITVQVEIAIWPCRDEHPFVHRPITVVVELIANFRHVGIRAAAQIITVLTTKIAITAKRVDDTVPIDVSISERGRIAIFVSAFGVAKLWIAGKTVRIGVVAIVTAAFHRARAIVIGVLGDGALGLA
jgi:hypothetical protein